MSTIHKQQKRARRQRRVYEELERLRAGLGRAAHRMDDHAVLEYQAAIEACNQRLERMGLC